jgi:hypothetical protein
MSRKSKVTTTRVPGDKTQNCAIEAEDGLKDVERVGKHMEEEAIAISTRFGSQNLNLSVVY